jgi:hypothetical protein
LLFLDKKGSREAEDKKLALGVKRKQLKRKKDRALECAVDSEPAAGHGVKEGNSMDFLSFSSHFFYILVFQKSESIVLSQSSFILYPELLFVSLYLTVLSCSLCPGYNYQVFFPSFLGNENVEQA